MAANPFRYFVGSLGSTKVNAEVNLSSMSWTPTLNRAGKWTAKVSPKEPLLEGLLHEWETVVYVSNRAKNKVYWGGVVETPHWEDGTWTLEGPELLGYLDRVFLHTAQGSTSLDQLYLIDLLVNSAPDFMATQRINGLAGAVLRDMTWTAEQMPSVLSILQKLAALSNPSSPGDAAFDFSLGLAWDNDSINRFVDIWFPNKGNMLPNTWEHGKAINVTSVKRDGTERAQRVWALGSGSSGVAGIQTASNELQGPTLELVLPAKDLNDALSLEQSAAAAAERNQNAHKTLACTIDVTHVEAPFGSWDIGDMVTAIADDVDLTIEAAEYRLTTAKFTVGDDGTLAVTDATLLEQFLPGDPIFDPDWRRDVIKLATRVSTLERRPPGAAIISSLSFPFAHSDGIVTKRIDAVATLSLTAQSEADPTIIGGAAVALRTDTLGAPVAIDTVVAGGNLHVYGGAVALTLPPGTVVADPNPDGLVFTPVGDEYVYNLVALSQQMVNWSHTTTLVQSGATISTTPMHTTVRNFGVFKNDPSASGISLGRTHGVDMAMTFLADTHATTITNIRDFRSAPTLAVLNAGQLTAANIRGFTSNMIVGIGALATSRHGFYAADATTQVVTGVTSVPASDWFTKTAHGLADGTPIAFSGLVLTAGVINGSNYYVLLIDPDTFQVSATLGGSVLPITGSADTGVITVTAQPIATQYGLYVEALAGAQTGYGVYSLAPVQIHYDTPIGTIFGNTAPLMITRHDPVAPQGYVNSSLALFHDSNKMNSYSWVQYIELRATTHPSADMNTSQSAGSTVRSFSRSTGSPAVIGFHAEPHHGHNYTEINKQYDDPSHVIIATNSTTLGVNIETNTLTATGTVAALNIQNVPLSGADTTYAINIQSTPRSSFFGTPGTNGFTNGINFQANGVTGIAGGTGINFTQAQYTLGINLNQNDMRLNPGQQIYWDGARSTYVFSGGIQFAINHAGTFANNPAFTPDLGDHQMIRLFPTFTGDTNAVPMTGFRGLFVRPLFTAINGGTLHVTQATGVQIGLNALAGATIDLRRGIWIKDTNSGGTGTGVVTKNIGIDIEVLDYSNSGNENSNIGIRNYASLKQHGNSTFTGSVTFTGPVFGISGFNGTKPVELLPADASYNVTTNPAPNPNGMIWWGSHYTLTAGAALGPIISDDAVIIAGDNWWNSHTTTMHRALQVIPEYRNAAGSAFWFGSVSALYDGSIWTADGAAVQLPANSQTIRSNPTLQAVNGGSIAAGTSRWYALRSGFNVNGNVIMNERGTILVEDATLTNTGPYTRSLGTASTAPTTTGPWTRTINGYVVTGYTQWTVYNDGDLSVADVGATVTGPGVAGSTLYVQYSDFGFLTAPATTNAGPVGYLFSQASDPSGFAGGDQYTPSSANNILTLAAGTFDATQDVGATVFGAGIPSGTTILSCSGATAVLSQSFTATGPSTVTLRQTSAPPAGAHVWTSTTGAGITTQVGIRINALAAGTSANYGIWNDSALMQNGTATFGSTVGSVVAPTVLLTDGTLNNALAATTELAFASATTTSGPVFRLDRALASGAAISGAGYYLGSFSFGGNYGTLNVYARSATMRAVSTAAFTSSTVLPAQIEWLTTSATSGGAVVNLILGNTGTVYVGQTTGTALATITQAGVGTFTGLGATPLDPTKLTGYPTDATKFLRGDNTWAVPAGTSYSAGTGLTLTGSTFSRNALTAADIGAGTFPGALTMQSAANSVVAATLARIDGFVNVPGAGNQTIEFVHDSTSASTAIKFRMERTRNIGGSSGVVSSGDYLGQLVASGHNGSGQIEASVLRALADGTWDSTHQPSRWEIATHPNSVTASVVAMIVDNAQKVWFGPTTGSALGSIDASGLAIFTTLQLTNPLTYLYGGTGQTAWTTGDLLYASGTNTPARRAIGSAGQFLWVSGGVPAWHTLAETDLLGWQTTIIGSDATNGVTVGSLLDITGMTVSIPAAGTYEFEAILHAQSDVNGTQFGVAYSLSASTGALRAEFRGPSAGAINATSAGTLSFVSQNSGTATASATFLAVASSKGVVTIRGMVVATASGTLSIQHLKVTSGTSTIKAGSSLRVRNTL